MCQLLGINFSEPRPFNRLFAEFRKRGESNPHAWGIAYWTGDGHGPAIIREARAAHESPLAAALASDPIPAVTVIGHVRLGTTSGEWSLRSTANAHPFLFRVGETDWVGAHNGYVRRAEPRFRRPEGTTDSEAFFCILADELEISKPLLVEDKMEVICRVAGKFTHSGKLNFLLSDGTYLFFSANHRAEAGGLYFRGVERSGQRALVVATRPLFTDRGWEKAEPGWLYVAKDGRVVKKRLIVPIFTGSAVLFREKQGVRPSVEGVYRHRSYIDYLEEEINRSKRKQVANFH
ncbi:MAG: class II glutamine amidotransferase [Moorellaceae bacterium]